jgi:uncharacterized membrane protein YsdA (DUF1294 family)
MLDLSVILSLANILRWIVIVGVVGFTLMGYDKLQSKVRKSRISEKNLWITALVGGFLGIVAGAVVFHHKVSKSSFWPPVLAAMALWLGLICVIIL